MYSKVLHVGSRQWMLGIIEDHRARPLTEDELDEVLKRLEVAQRAPVEPALSPSGEALREEFVAGVKYAAQGQGRGMFLENWGQDEAERRYPRQSIPEPRAHYICINDHHRNDFLLVDGYKICAEPGCRAEAEPVEPAPEPKETK